MPDNKALFESLYRDYHPLVLQLCRGFMKGDMDLAKGSDAGGVYQYLACAR